MNASRKEQARKYYLANREEIKAKARAYRKRNSEKVRNSQRERWASLSPAERERALRYYRAYARRNRKRLLEKARIRKGFPLPTRPCPPACECCGRSSGKRALGLDHCHSAGKFRGWLCGSCNRGMGYFGDTITGLMRAVRYLRRVSR